jgi:hypothetical protein
VGIEQRRREVEPEPPDARPERAPSGPPEGRVAREAHDGGEGDVAADIRAKGRSHDEGKPDEHPVREGVLGALDVTAAVIEVTEVAKVVGPLL